MAWTCESRHWPPILQKGAHSTQDQAKWFSFQKCYGFIEAEDGRDYFVHERAIIAGTPCDNALVEFEIGSNAKGPCAVNARVL